MPLVENPVAQHRAHTLRGPRHPYGGSAAVSWRRKPCQIGNMLGPHRSCPTEGLLRCFSPSNLHTKEIFGCAQMPIGASRKHAGTK